MSQQRAASKKKYEITYLFTITPRNFYEKVCEECTKNSNPMKAWKIIGPRKKHSLFNEVFDTLERATLTEEEVKKYLQSRKKKKLIVNVYVKIIMKLNDFFGFSLNECLGLIRYVSKTENLSTMGDPEAYFKLCAKTVYANRDYIISAFLRILVEAYSTKGTSDHHEEFKNTVMCPHASNWLSLVLRNIHNIHGELCEKPSKNMYLQSEKSKFGKMLIYLTNDCYYNLAYIDHIFDYINISIDSYVEGNMNNLLSKTTPEELHIIKEESRELVYIMILCFYRMLDCRTNKRRFVESYTISQAMNEVKGKDGILGQNDEYFKKLQGKVPKEFTMCVDDDHEEFLNKGVYGLICIMWSLYLRNKAAYESRNNIPTSRQTRKTAFKYFNTGMTCEAMEFLREVFLKREFLDVRRGATHSILAMTYVEGMCVDLIEGESSNVYILYEYFKREKKFLRKGERFPVIPEGEAKFRYYKKKNEDLGKRREGGLAFPIFEDIWKLLRIVYKRLPLRIPNLTVERRNPGCFQFLFKISPDFLKEMQKLKDYDADFSFAVFFKLVAILARNSNCSKDVFIDFQKSTFFTWVGFFREIKSMMENSGRIENTGYEARLIAALQLIEAVTFYYPPSRRAFLERDEMSVISLFDLTSFKHTTSKLMGQVLKTLSSFVDVSTPGVVLQLWKGIENISNFPNAIAHQFVNVEHKKKEYYETRGFLKLFCKFVEHGVSFPGSKSLKSPISQNNGFFNPLFHFCKTYVFEPFDAREYKKPKEKWKIVIYCLKIFHKLLKQYEPSQMDFIRKDSQFILMKDMLTNSRFLNTIFRILFGGKVFTKFDIKEKAVLYCLKILDAVLQKEEKFRIAKLGVVDQKRDEFLQEKGGNPSSSTSNKNTGSSMLVDQGDLDGMFHIIPLYEQFSTKYIIELLNYLHLPLLPKIRFYAIRILGVLCENRPQIIEIFVTREKHLYLLRLMMENLMDDNELIRLAILDLLGKNILNERSPTHFLCGLSEPEGEYYRRHHKDKNILNLLLNVVVKNEEILSNQFLEKVYEVILRLCEDGRIRKRMFLTLEKENFFNNSLKYFSKEKRILREIKYPIQMEDEEMNNNNNNRNINKDYTKKKDVVLEYEKPLYYYTGMGYLLKIIALKIYNDTRKYENEEERKANLAGLDELISLLFYHFDPNQPSMMASMGYADSPDYQKRQKKTLMSELLDELNHNKFHQLPPPILPVPIPELMNIIEKDCLYVSYSLTNRTNVGSVSRGIGEIRQYDVVRLHQIITLYKERNPSLSEHLTPEKMKIIGFNALLWNEYYRYSSSFNHFFTGWRTLFDTTLMLYQEFDISYIFQILRGLLLKIRLQDIDKNIESDLAHLIFRCLITLRSAKKKSKYLLSPSQCVTIIKEIFAVFSKSSLSQESRASLYLAIINYLRYTSSFLASSLTHESLSIGLFSPLRGNSNNKNKTVFQLICDDAVKLNDRRSCVALSVLESVFAYDFNNQWVQLISSPNGFLPQLIEMFESFPSILFPKAKNLRRDLLLEKEEKLELMKDEEEEIEGEGDDFLTNDNNNNLGGFRGEKSVSTERTLISRYREERELRHRRMMIFESISSLLMTILSTFYENSKKLKERIKKNKKEEEDDKKDDEVGFGRSGNNDLFTERTNFGLKQYLFELSFRVFQSILGEYGTLMEKQFGPTLLYSPLNNNRNSKRVSVGDIPVEQRLTYHQLIMPVLRLILVISTSNPKNIRIFSGLVAFIKKFERFFIAALSSQEFSSPHLEELNLMYLMLFELARRRKMQEEMKNMKNGEDTSSEILLMKFESKILQSFSFLHQKNEKDIEEMKRRKREGRTGTGTGLTIPKVIKDAPLIGAGLFYDPSLDDISADNIEQKKRDIKNIDIGRERSVYLRKILQERAMLKERRMMLLQIMNSFLSFLVKRHPRIMFSNLVKVQYSSLDMASTTSSYYPELKKSSISLLFRIFLSICTQVERIERRFTDDGENEEVDLGIFEKSKEWDGLMTILEKTLFLVYYHLKFYLVNSILDKDKYLHQEEETYRVRNNILPQREKRELINNCRGLLKPLDRLMDLSVLKGKEYLLYVTRSIKKMIRKGNNN